MSILAWEPVGTAWACYIQIGPNNDPLYVEHSKTLLHFYNRKTRNKEVTRATEKRSTRTLSTKALRSEADIWACTHTPKGTRFLCSVRRLLLTANVLSSSPILVTLMMEALNSSATSVLTKATLRSIPEDGILHSHRHENLKSYISTLVNYEK
jgi:hypothetical protein